MMKPNITEDDKTPKLNFPAHGGINHTGISQNTDTHVISITEDKLLGIIKSYEQRLVKSNGWATYLGILLTLGTTLAASTFNQFILSPETWGNLFMCATAIFFFLTLRTGWLRLKENPMSAEALVDTIAGRKNDG